MKIAEFLKGILNVDSTPTNLLLYENIARKKNNLLICEGYMDVISLYENGIQSVVAPLGTALTQEQLNLAWHYSTKPTIMFDGDKAGLRASFKSALMSLSMITPKRFLQFITLNEKYDPARPQRASTELRSCQHDEQMMPNSNLMTVWAETFRIQ